MIAAVLPVGLAIWARKVKVPAPLPAIPLIFRQTKTYGQKRLPQKLVTASLKWNTTERENPGLYQLIGILAMECIIETCLFFLGTHLDRGEFIDHPEHGIRHPKCIDRA